MRGEQRHAADLAKVDPDKITGHRSPGELGPAAPPLLRFVGRRIENFDTLIRQQPGDGVHGIGGQVGALEGSGNVRHRDGPAFPCLSH